MSNRRTNIIAPAQSSAGPIQRPAPDPLKAFLMGDEAQSRLLQVATKVMKPQDLVRMALMARSRNPDLAKCTHHSVLRALMDAAEMGIAPGGVMGRGYLVPRLNRKIGEMECSFDPGWRGLIDIARRSGLVARIESHVVYAKDTFRVVKGVESRIDHEPTLDDDPGPFVAVYAIAFFKDGGYQFEFLRKSDVDKLRALGAGGGPWNAWYDEMARKSAVRRLCKYLPFDSLMEKALQASSDEPIEVDGEAVDVAPAPPAAVLEKADTGERASAPAPPAAVLEKADTGERASALAARLRRSPEANGEALEMLPEPSEPGYEGEAIDP